MASLDHFQPVFDWGNGLALLVGRIRRKHPQQALQAKLCACFGRQDQVAEMTEDRKSRRRCR